MRKSFYMGGEPEDVAIKTHCANIRMLGHHPYCFRPWEGSLGTTLVLLNV